MTTLDKLTGPFVSLVGRLGAARYPPDEPAVGRVFCTDPTQAQAFGSRVTWYCGVGRDIDTGVASAAAIGEAFERYGLRDLDHSRTATASMSELTERGQRYLEPSELVAVKEPASSVPLVDPPATDVPIRWFHSLDLVTGEDVLVPAQYCIYMEHGCSDCGAGENPWYLPTSNGTAAGTSPVRAGLSGLLELIERDAFMLMWYHRLRFPFLRIDPYSRIGRRIPIMFGRARIEVRFLDLTEVHGIPTVVAVARGRVGDREVYALGGSADLDMETAVWKAAREAAGLYTLARGEASRGGADTLTPDRIVRFEDHLRYYTNPAHHHELAFLLDERETESGVRERAETQTPERALRRLTRELRERGIRTYTVNLTPPGTRLDIYSYKTVSPDLVPLDFHHQIRHVNRERLLNEPTRRGWRSDQPNLEQLNHAPHPFP